LAQSGEACFAAERLAGFYLLDPPSYSAHQADRADDGKDDDRENDYEQPAEEDAPPIAIGNLQLSPGLSLFPRPP
jgi:hypothetical protein